MRSTIVVAAFLLFTSISGAEDAVVDVRVTKWLVLAPVDAVARRTLRADAVTPAIARGAPATVDADAVSAFRPGDRVRAVNRHPHGHTREPRYVRGHVGVVEWHHGVHRHPDRSAEGMLEGRHLYTVRFDLRELWGSDAGHGAVLVDLWEDYLEPAP